MKIEHVGLWVSDLEATRAFYEKYFNATSNAIYTNEKNHFQSYFLTFESGSRLEIMTKPDLTSQHQEYLGYAHLALSVGSAAKVDQLVKQFLQDGYQVVGQPRTTGDGYYEAIVLDPEANRIELTI